MATTSVPMAVMRSPVGRGTAPNRVPSSVVTLACASPTSGSVMARWIAETNQMSYNVIILVSIFEFPLHWYLGRLVADD